MRRGLFTKLAVGLIFAFLLPHRCNAQVNNASRPGPDVDADRSTSVWPSHSSSEYNFFACGAEATQITGDASVSRRAIRLGLAMADFTGDTHPDLATINVAGSDSYETQYVIDVRLTEGGRQSLYFSAPPSGLLITPKDVTGDGTLDLVVRDAGSRAVVAVFLNDGCGRFSKTQPTSLARATGDGWLAVDLTVPTDSPSGPVATSGSQQIEWHPALSGRLHERIASILPANWNPLLQINARYSSDRAPPIAS